MTKMFPGFSSDRELCTICPKFNEGAICLILVEKMYGNVESERLGVFQ
jgi:hypothetical protein